jgi:hypothetical protein
MPGKQKSTRRKSTKLKKTPGVAGSKMFLVAIVGLIIVGGGIAAYFMMPGLFSNNDAVTWDSATEVIRDRTVVAPSDAPPDTGEDEEPVDEYVLVNPILMNLFGMDIDGVRHAVPAPSAVAQSAFLGEVEIFDVEFDIYWNFIGDIAAHPERYMGDAEIMIMLSLVDRNVMDTHGNTYTDAYDSGMVYPGEFTYNHTVPATELLTGGSSYITLSLVNDLFGSFVYMDINAIDDAALVDAMSAGLMNQVLEADNVTITELAGMLTFEYGILGYYMVNELGSDANRALKRLTVTTDPVIPEEVGGMSVYDIGGVSISDTSLLIVGLGVFGMIVVYYYIRRR